MSRSGIGQSDTKWLKRAGGDDGSLWDPRPHLAGRRVVLRHKPPDQIVAESGAVDHLYEKAVGDGVEHLRDVHSDGYGSARGLCWLKS